MSDSNQFSDNVIDDVNNQNGKLPQFLNVLTILTFIGSGLSLLSALWNLATLSTQKASFEASAAMMEGLSEDSPLGGTMNSMMEGARVAMENAPILNTAAILAAILCIVGAVLMRKRKKTGFYAYVVGCIISVLVPIIILGTGFMGAMIIFGSIFTIAFVVMYGLNLKHLN